MKTITITIEADKLTGMKQIMAGAAGTNIVDVITDQIVLSGQLSAKERAGAGHVLKFLRSLNSPNQGGALLQQTETTTNQNTK